MSKAPSPAVIPPHAFARAQWQAAGPARPMAAGPLKILTWNVWFGAHKSRVRQDALLAEISRRSPDVILLQEVTRKLLAAIVDTPWVRAGYQVSDVDGSTFSRYGVLLLSRIPIRRLVMLDLPTEMGRRLLSAELSCGITVATVHLESTSECVSTRVAQLGIIQPSLAASSPDVVFAGDMNFAPDAAAENAALDPTFVDVWPALHGDRPGHTVDTSINFMRYVMHAEHSHKRIDRVFLRSRAWSPRAATLVGVEPIDEEGTFVSDHFGIEVELAPA
ncbi:endonuclease/exonuclease/phosphatase family protein [Polyangium sorediatum]|uniref:Endonuclease/exonuclease/phosphatase family protein n=1 Tax=Polyangium sorediatum TaxID=889274 RepID=A0ABT6NLJ4_9BACT|nr:endonuclease/exonuclease/phosphatase family protein [Polyangium sorediatum]MDI1429095.1 endonuclease/exonuclease/phosphatase family protein [Polyangium sorediatum]